jgi:hypothetical protein
MLLQQLLTEEVIISQSSQLENCFKEIFEASVPKFPGTELRSEIDASIKKASKLLYDFAKAMLPFAIERKYKTDTLQKIIDNPEKVAKFLVAKYAKDYADDAIAFKVTDILKDIDLNLE